MSYELSYKHEPDYLYVQATGIYNVENQIAMARDCLAECDKHRYSKLLLDVRRMTGGSDIDVGSTYDLIIKDIRAIAIHSPLQVAAIDLEELGEGPRFVETLAYNAGLNIHVFTDADEAMEWLGVSESFALERGM